MGVVIAAGTLALSTALPLPPAARFAVPLVAALAATAAYALAALRSSAPLAVLLALPCVFSAAAVGAAGARWRHRLEDYKAGLRAQGRPTGWTDLARLAPAGPAVDAAAAAAFEAQQIPVNKKVHPGLETAPWDERVLREESEFLREAEGPVLGRLEALLAGHPASFARIDWAEAQRRPFDVRMPRYASFIAAAQVLRLSAVRSAHRGEAAAWDRVRTSLDLADLLSRDPYLISRVIAVSLRVQAAKGAATISLAPKAPALPRDVAERLAVPAGPDWVTAGLQGELAVHLAGAEHLSRMSWKDFANNDGFNAWSSGGCLASEADDCKERGRSLSLPLEGLLMKYAQASGLIELNALESARLLALEASPAPPDELQARNAALERQVEAWTAWPYFLAKLTSPRYSALQYKAWDSVAWSRMAAAAWGLKSYRAAFGRYPERLDALAPRFAAAQDLIDPLLGAPFEYSSADGGYELCAAKAEPRRADRACVMTKRPAGR